MELRGKKRCDKLYLRIKRVDALDQPPRYVREKYPAQEASPGGRKGRGARAPAIGNRLYGEAVQLLSDQDHEAMR